MSQANWLRERVLRRRPVARNQGSVNFPEPRNSRGGRLDSATATVWCTDHPASDAAYKRLRSSG
jgi:hypothetical protein